MKIVKMQVEKSHKKAVPGKWPS